MRKFLTILFMFIFLTAPASFAEDDLWDNFGDQNFYGQMPVSDEDFEKALESKTKKKKRNKNIPKGSEFHQGNETEFINESGEELPVICVPAELIISEDKILPIGHYQVEGKKKDGKPVLNFYQAHYKLAEFPAVETEDDFDQEAVHFVKLLENSDKQVKIIFGSLDFNAYSIINIAE